MNDAEDEERMGTRNGVVASAWGYASIYWVFALFRELIDSKFVISLQFVAIKRQRRWKMQAIKALLLNALINYQLSITFY